MIPKKSKTIPHRVVLSFFLLGPLLYIYGQIERVEPPFWWGGMENTELQLMIYGKDIKKLSPKLEYAGVTIKRTVAAENPNYLFIYLEIDPETLPGKIEISLTNEKGKIQEKLTYDLLKREENSSQRMGYNSSDVMCLITPDRFANGNPDNDTVEGLFEPLGREDKWGRHGGDIKGIEDHLDYLSEMGFTAVWINPILENNQKKYSYHGYSTTDFYKVDLRFGTNKEYEELSKKAKSKGIKLIMDMIMNHCGSGHWWMTDLPSSDWINNPEHYTETNHRRTTLRDPYTSDYDKEIFTDGWFVPTMPDLNQRNPQLAEYLIQNTIWWIEYAGLSGIRMDTYPYSDKDFMTDWTCSIMREYPNFSICGEEWSLNPAVLAYWQQGKQNPDGYTSCLPGLLDFPIQNALVTSLTEKENWDNGMINLYTMLSNDFLYADPYKHVIFPDNHDMSRIYSQLGEDYDLFKLAMVYFTTMRGTPQFYYGTEILMSNTGDNSHGNIRSDFPGGWQGDKMNAFTGKGLTKRQLEAQTFVKRLLNWRKKTKVIHHGKLMHFVPVNGVYVYFRYDESEKVMIVLNKSREKRELDLKPLAEMLNGIDSGLNILTSKTIPLHKSINVEARQPMIIELD
ncbi:glycoside hydrolase family 13 protein [Flagellimonas marinaquae]|uniref:glycoside hydrolase family 13 protein n=1 Tax=Flagellimonas marinaquae TaxID=254955 RepID=UPI000F8C30AC|nr:glycoside hydrolase family 13 protein [Allomuricauda aquimarina]